MNRTNTIIVGQGIAGSMVAFLLHQQDVPFIVIDPGLAGTSSRVAAGMFTPVSGKRKTIDPIALQQIPFAINIYQQVERTLGIKILYLQDICQVFHSLAEQKELIAKFNNQDFAKYIKTEAGQLPGIKQEFGSCMVTHSGWVDCEAMISGVAGWLHQTGNLVKETFAYGHLKLTNGQVMYKDIQCNNIIFCEGYQGVHNPYFDQENIIPCKGDILTVNYEHLKTERVIKRNGVYLIPSGNGLFRAGSTYRWNNNSLSADEAGKKILEDKLDDMLEKSFTVVDHKTAIRPTTKNREPIAKVHAEYPNIFMLNGLGTKGILQGPWWAVKMVDLIMRKV